MGLFGGTRRRPGGSTQLISTGGEADSSDGCCAAGPRRWDASGEDAVGEAVEDGCAPEPAPGGSGVFRHESPRAKLESTQKARIFRVKRPAMRALPLLACASPS